MGLPFEVWKTHMGTYRNEGTIEAFRNVYRKGGVGAFWRGWEPKMVESFIKGGILLFAKEGIIRTATGAGMSEMSAGLLGGFGGGCAQVTVLGPCTFLVTAAVTGDKSISLYQRTVSTYKEHGIKGFYRGGTALMLRQGKHINGASNQTSIRESFAAFIFYYIFRMHFIGSNWASRQFFTEGVRELIKKRHLSEKDGIVATSQVKLTVAEEAISGIIGGAISTWNQPFEVMRIDAQAAATKGLPSRSFTQTFQHILKENGPAGFFRGVIPRMGLCISQTLFLVTVPKLLKPYGL